MADDPYGYYGAANAEPDWRANPGHPSTTERWGYQGDYRRGSGRRSTEPRSFRREGGYGPDYGSPDYEIPDYSAADAAAAGYGLYERDPVGPHYGRPFNDPRARRYGGEADEYARGGGYRGEHPHRADHRGLGPKGYRRSDERIREEVSDRLTDDPLLDPSDVEVKVHDGEVTLDGAVSSREDKRRAEMLVERCSGVDHVQNNLRVKRPEHRATTTASGPGGLPENEIVNRVAEGKTRL
ncbi:MAG: BON domain-containing protein [Caulobacteraceae bacterium]|nr:BON domain-containing protein [Caulobacteraceae bacterium]